jgi:MtN3 and saliva related transmembrane protein
METQTIDTNTCIEQIINTKTLDETTITTIGYIGAVLLDITLLPQLYKTFKSKQTRDISIYFMFLQIITCIFFLTYGILLNEAPIMMANSILMLELLVLLYAKIRYSYCITEQNRTEPLETSRKVKFAVV